MIEIRLTAEHVKAEAERRILAFYPLHKQLNDAERQVELRAIGRDRRTPGEEAEMVAIRKRQTRKDEIRAASNRLEQGPIPLDFRNDKHWGPDHG